MFFKQTSMSRAGRFLIGIGAVTLLAVSPAAAQSQTTDIRPDANRLTGEDLLDAFLGVTYEGAYNFTPEGEPRRFFSEAHHKNNKVSYTEDGATVSGVWTILRDTVCYQYRGDDLTGGCFRVYQVGNCVYFYNNLRAKRPLEIGENYWTARGTRKGEVPDCEPNIS